MTANRRELTAKVLGGVLGMMARHPGPPTWLSWERDPLAGGERLTATRGKRPEGHIILRTADTRILEEAP